MSCATVVRTGSANPARSMSSKPTTLTSSGHGAAAGPDGSQCAERHDVVVAQDPGHIRMPQEQGLGRRCAARHVAVAALDGQASRPRAAPMAERLSHARQALGRRRVVERDSDHGPGADGRGPGGAPRRYGRRPGCRSSLRACVPSCVSLFTSTVRQVSATQPLRMTTPKAARRDHYPIHASGCQQLQERAFALRIVGAVAQQDHVAPVPCAILDGSHQLREEWVLDVGDEQAKGVGRAQLEGAGHARRPVVESPCGR